MRWLAVLPALTLYAQTSGSPALTPEIVRLGHIKAHVQEILSKIPDYTCLQTIERSRRLPRTRRFQLLDTLRLEVALVNGRELFAWPGAGRFDDREIGQFVGGTIGNGNFALHARSVFFGHVPRYEYAGEVTVDDKRAHRYNFFIPRFQSGFTLRVEKLQGVAGYHGYFEVEAQSFDLLTLAIETDDIPEHLPIAGAKDTMRYARALIGEKEFLLPKSSELILTDMEGNENRNRVTFTGCRQYTGESVITFADPPPTSETPPPPPTPVVPVTLPEGLYLTVVNDTPVRFDTAAIGDPVKERQAQRANHRPARSHRPRPHHLFAEVPGPHGNLPPRDQTHRT